MISSEALFRKAAKLPRIEIIRPKTVIGKDTVSSMQAGILYGYAALVDGLVERIKGEVRSDPKVIATGGLAKIIAPEAKSIHVVDDMLTLEGLRIVYKRNS
jgi:type III pantothenate kinase